MKKFTITTALFLTTIVSVFANTIEINNPEKPILEKEEKPTKIYQWQVKTTTDFFTGTTTNLVEATHRLEKISENNTIISKEIQPITLEQDVNATKIYTWGIAADYGYASGTSATYAEAQSMLKRMSKGDVIHGEIIESYNIEK